MRIACIGYMHGKGGAEKQLILLANALSKHNEVFLFTLCDKNICFSVDSQVTIVDLTYAENSRIKSLARLIALRDAYKKIKPDISIHFWLQTAYLTAFLPFSVRKRIIYSERNDPNDVEYKGLNAILRKIAFQKIDGFVFQTEFAQQYFHSNIKKRSIVLHNPVFVDEQKYKAPCKKRKRIVITAGRLVERKNQKLLIDAFALIAKDFKDYSLSIYGDGPLMEQLIIHSKNIGIEDRVNVYPSVDDIYDRIFEASLFVLTSEYEGMPNVLIEAMALGTPCISTDCRPGGARALISSGKNGILVPLNDEEVLAKKMRQILQDTKYSYYLANNAISIRESHSPNKIYDKWESFIKECVIRKE